MSAADVLAADGPLADILPGFAPRDVQQVLSTAVEAALAQGTTLIAEAGTGVGKSMAYLVPVMRSGRRTVISTATRHLQDQLFQRDVPLARRALGYGEPIALLKGRANYLCHYRLLHVQDERSRLRPAALGELQHIEAWSQRTRDGDIAEVAEVAEDSSIWPRVTSTVENCLGSECPQLAGCHVLNARRNAQAAQIVVVNHHLLFADMALKEEGFGEVLPSAEAMILDEAHQLPEIASNFFGEQLSTRQLLGLAQDARIEQLREARDAGDIAEQAAQVDKAARDLRLEFGSERRRAPWHEAPPAVLPALARLRDALRGLQDALKANAPRSKGLEHCHRRAQTLLRQLQGFTEDVSEEDIRWFETFAQGFALRSTPVDVSGLFQGFMSMSEAAWVFTSATLSVGGSFQHFRQRLGLHDAQELQLDSPFDYRRNALLYLPANLPDPGSREHSDAVAEVARKVLAASRGRAFVLLTSFRALRHVADELRRTLEFPVLVQGEAPKADLLDQFRAAGDAVLVGTSSFWEGVDVRGDALSCVLIDKLPFAALGDPVLQSRLEAFKRQGLEPFREFQLPHAVIALKQGVGRLIRDTGDRGVLVLCDPRLRTRGYGRVFIDSLPPMPVTDDIEDVNDFFSRC
ncbi:MAG: ATP-dependent DNA helicase [Gammaproteobacteria bacterium]|nr:ATP-dependent DNA helicase [Gammaproteobacteria bacterium]